MQLRKPRSAQDDPVEEAPAPKKVDVSKTLEDTDDLLADIDALLEDLDVDELKNFRQRGGQ